MSASVDLHDGFLRVHFGELRHSDFHLRWLRHNCSQDLHPLTGERTVCSSELADDLRALSATISGNDLVIEWARDVRESRYSLGWLEEHAYAKDRAHIEIPSDVSAISVDARGLSTMASVESALVNLQAFGAAVVRRDPASTRPAEEETELLIEAFSRAGLDVIGTHFGRIEDLRTDNSTNANTDQLGYTDSAVDLHTDQPFLEKPPRLQMLQCIRAAEVGGDNYLVDVRSAARHLRSVDRAAYDLLRSTPIRFHRKQKGFEKILDATILSGEDESFQVRWSYFTLAPYRFAFEEMEAWYRAHDRFARLVRDRQNQYRFALNAGDFVLYDNYRMVHARTGFRGARWMRGVYLDHSARTNG